MPCALTSDADYPDYLKKILKEIDIGGDDELKDCACKIITPFTDEGCEILDEDNKVAAFPGCLIVCDNENPCDNSQRPFSLKEIMEMYWKTKSITLSMTFIWSSPDAGESCPSGTPQTISFSDTLSFVEYPVFINGKMQTLQSKKNIEKVCPLGMYKGYHAEIAISPTPRREGNTDLYSLDIDGYGEFYPVGGNGTILWQLQIGNLIDLENEGTGTFNGKNIFFSWGFDEGGLCPHTATGTITSNF